MSKSIYYLLGLTAVVAILLPIRGRSERLANAPTPVLVESTTGDGGRDAEVDRILGVLERAVSVLQAPDELTARRAGRLRYLAKSDDGIDALVAAAAVGDGSPAALLTSDPDDLQRLLQTLVHGRVETRDRRGRLTVIASLSSCT